MGSAESWASVFESCIHTIVSDRCGTSAAKDFIVCELEKYSALPEPTTEDERSFRLEQIKTRLHAIMSVDRQLAGRYNVFSVDAVKLYEVLQLVRHYLERPYESSGTISALNACANELMERIDGALMQHH